MRYWLGEVFETFGRGEKWHSAMQNKENEPEVECILLHEYGSHHLHLLNGLSAHIRL